MRDEVRRKLDRLLLMQRLKRGAIAVAAGALLGGLFLLTDLDAKVVDRPVAGKVEAVSIPNLANATKAVAVEVLLDDGRHAKVLVQKEHEPHVGDRVKIVEHKHATGRVTFTWR